MCGHQLYAPDWGPGPQPRCVPWLGIEPWLTGWCSIYWATPSRAIVFFLINFFIFELQLTFKNNFHSNLSTYEINARRSKKILIVNASLKTVKSCIWIGGCSFQRNHINFEPFKTELCSKDLKLLKCPFICDNMDGFIVMI